MTQKRRTSLACLVLAVFTLAIGQSCTKSEAHSGNSAPGGVAVVGPDATLSVSGDPVLDQKRDWVLIRLIQDGNEVTLPADQIFVMRLARQAHPDEACTGSCPRRYELSGHGFCGVLNGQLTQAFDERSSRNLNSFEQLRVPMPARCPGARTDRQVIGWLASPKLEMTYDDGQELLYWRSGGRVLVFEGHPVTDQGTDGQLVSAEQDFAD